MYTEFLVLIFFTETMNWYSSNRQFTWPKGNQNFMQTLPVCTEIFLLRTLVSVPLLIITSFIILYHRRETILLYFALLYRHLIVDTCVSPFVDYNKDHNSLSLERNYASLFCSSFQFILLLPPRVAY